MFRMWGKVFKDNHLIRDIVIENDHPTLNRTRKVFSALEEICIAFDLGQPIWLDSTINDFRRHSNAASPRMPLWSRLTSIFWRSTLSRSKHSAVHLSTLPKEPTSL